MGQISLARVNRINVSMQWESNLKANQYSWLSTKIYILLRLFVPIIFHVNKYNFFKLWGPTLTKHIISSYLISGYLQITIKKRHYKLYRSINPKPLLTIPQIYIARLHDLTYIYVVYSDLTVFDTNFKLIADKKKINSPRSLSLFYL